MFKWDFICNMHGCARAVKASGPDHDSRPVDNCSCPRRSCRPKRVRFGNHAERDGSSSAPPRTERVRFGKSRDWSPARPRRANQPTDPSAGPPVHEHAPSACRRHEAPGREKPSTGASAPATQACNKTPTRPSHECVENGWDSVKPLLEAMLFKPFLRSCDKDEQFCRTSAKPRSSPSLMANDNAEKVLNPRPREARKTRSRSA